MLELYRKDNKGFFRELKDKPSPMVNQVSLNGNESNASIKIDLGSPSLDDFSSRLSFNRVEKAIQSLGKFYVSRSFSSAAIVPDESTASRQRVDGVLLPANDEIHTVERQRKSNNTNNLNSQETFTINVQSGSAASVKVTPVNSPSKIKRKVSFSEDNVRQFNDVSRARGSDEHSFLLPSPSPTRRRSDSLDEEQDDGISVLSMQSFSASSTGRSTKKTTPVSDIIPDEKVTSAENISSRLYKKQKENLPHQKHCMCGCRSY